MAMLNDSLENKFEMIAAKLLNNDVSPSKYTKALAKKKTSNCVGVVMIHKLIDGFSIDIKKAMVKMKKNNSKK